MIMVLVCLFAGSTLLSGHQFDMMVRTTSDWTELNFSGTPVVVLEQKRIRTTEGLKVNAFHISQPEPDSIGSNLLYKIILPEPVPEEFRMTITKGDIGSTTALFRGGSSAEPILVVDNSGNKADDATNEQTTVISMRSLLQRPSLATYELEAPDVPKLVLAFYYPWYGTPGGPSGKWMHWNPSRGYSSSHHPLLGYYDSSDIETIRKHIRWARESGIDAFVVSWWRMMDNMDIALGKLVQICSKEHFSVCVLVEKGEKLEESLRYLSKRYFRSPQYLKVDGKPVVFYYERALSEYGRPRLSSLFQRLSSDGIAMFNLCDGYAADLFDDFDGAYSYNPVFSTDLKNYTVSGSMSLHLKGKVFAATVVPGFDQTVTRTDGRYLSREDGDLYRQMWENAMGAGAEWVLVTSFNEWHEGTEIEPSREHGTKYLDLTRTYSKMFRGR